MKRLALICLVGLLAACSRPDPAALSIAIPGLNVARAALEDGSPTVALSVSEGILKEHPDDVAALIYKGDALVLMNRVPEGEESYRAALTFDPHAVGAQMGLARLRLRVAPLEAQAMFLDVLKQQPRNLMAMNDLGIACDLLGDHAAAQLQYRKVLGTDPTQRSASVNLAVSMALSGQAAEAVTMLRKVADEPGSSTRVRHDLAAALALAGDQDGASRILSQDMSAEEVLRVLRAFQAYGT
jgi:Flp pilus assembly protein TadD